VREKRNRKININFNKLIVMTFLFLMGILYLRIVQVTLMKNVDGVNLKTFASRRNTTKQTLNASRGVIYDRNGNILAIDVSSYTVVAFLNSTRTGSLPKPRHVIDKEFTAEALAPVLNMTKESILALLERKVYQVELGPGGRNITELKKSEIEDLNLPGIEFISNSKRYYPNGDFASYLLGYAKRHETLENGIINYQLVGELGIESLYNDVLTGTNGYLEYQRDNKGYKIPDTKEIRIDPIPGNDIYLTIDSKIQRLIENASINMKNTRGFSWSTITVMDAKSGDILGSSSNPSFDPNRLNITNYENPLVSYLYEPGSVMKIYSYMCAIEKGTYDGSKTFNSTSYSIQNDVIVNWHKEGFGIINYDQGFEFSSNVAIGNMMDNFINRSDLRECYKDFGFGQKTNIELPREMTGNTTFTWPIEVVTAGFGQGISTTPIQQLQALTVLSNNGSMVKPNIIKTIKGTEIIYEREIIKTEPLVSQSTIDYMTELMDRVVNNTSNRFTTGKGYHVKDFKVIGKTGTAQIYDPVMKKYIDEYIYSFGGMFPKEDPEIIIYAAVRGKSNQELIRQIRELIVNIEAYLDITEKERENHLREYIAENYINQEVDKLSLPNVNTIIIGNGDRVISQNVTPNTKLLSCDSLILMTNGTEFTMPNLKGLSRANAEVVLKYLNLDYEIIGYGFVTKQNIPVGKLLTSEDKIEITLNRKYNLDKIE
jgi:penicillin-binding protein 2B